MKLYLVRHGETDWNLQNRIQGQTDTPLNEQGRRQAQELAMKLKEKHHISSLYSSRQKRAFETAQVVGRMIGLEPQIRQGLEEISLGKWEGYTWRQVREQFPEAYQAWYNNRRYQVPPQGESYQQLLDRLLPTLADLMEKNGGNVLAVTHSAVIMTLLSFVYDTPFEDMAKNYKTGNTGIVEIEPDLFFGKYKNTQKA
ncbi:MAG: histidine phosphatase family protein [Lachnospiraceae bacterium]|nr:histidine phosphatase family protein [Lachnospiraceae bacterium]